MTDFVVLDAQSCWLAKVSDSKYNKFGYIGMIIVWINYWYAVFVYFKMWVVKYNTL